MQNSYSFLDFSTNSGHEIWLREMKGNFQWQSAAVVVTPLFDVQTTVAIPARGEKREFLDWSLSSASVSSAPWSPQLPG